MRSISEPTRRVGKTRNRTLIKVGGAFIVALFVLLPVALNSYVGIGFNPILSASMEPYAHRGDLLITKKIATSEIKVGDILVLVSQESGVFYAHRVQKISYQSGLMRIVTKGDANQEADITPFMASTTGKVSKNIQLIPLVGKPMIWLSSFQGRQASLALLVIANVIGLFLFLFREKVEEISKHLFNTYRELYVEAMNTNKEKRDEARVYRELYQESQATNKEKRDEALIYRELYQELQGEEVARNEELEQLAKEMQLAYEESQ
ncbi:MAG: signal peptidase I [Streptomycetaceae bacterium]|nr:MAG: signal peptidase I [Streptomycetaceae bacterium]